MTVREIAERLARLVNPSIAPMFGAIEDRPLETVRLAETARTEKDDRLEGPHAPD